jgi:hypothetical protein
MTKNSPIIRFSLRRLFAMIVVVAAAGGLYVATVGQSPMLRLFGGGENMAIVREATRVEAYRLGPPPGGDPPQDYISPLDYEVASGPVAVPAKMARELATTLLSPDTYTWGTAKACGFPVYGVKLSFFRGPERVDVFFCFRCDDLTVTRDGKKLGAGDFSEAKRPFVEAVKALFPDDQEIQQIGR